MWIEAIDFVLLYGSQLNFRILKSSRFQVLEMKKIYGTYFRNLCHKSI